MVPTVWHLIEALWIIIPAYAANGLVPLAKGKRPIDINKKFIDGQPLFGKGKTWEGFCLGCVIGVVIASIEMFAFPFLPFDQAPVPLTIVPMSPLLGFLLGSGAMCGDLTGSFIKRRFKIPRGKSAPLLDQEDFLIGALFFAWLIMPIKIEWVIILLIITPLIHWIASILGYLLKLKREPY